MHGSITVIYATKGQVRTSGVNTPVSECPYQAPDRCSGNQRLSCCERVAPGTTTAQATAGAPPQTQISVGVGLVMLLLGVMMAI